RMKGKKGGEEESWTPKEKWSSGDGAKAGESPGRRTSGRGGQETSAAVTKGSSDFCCLKALNDI
ncbi:hypothetical protein RUM43_004265, partial [Polyplax serrata]